MKITFFLLVEIRENPTLHFSGWARILELSFCLCKTLLKLSGIQFFKKIPARGRLFLQEDNWFSCWWKPFCLHFSESLTNASFFFRQAEKYFSTKSFISASENGFSGQWKLFFFVQRFFLRVETVTETRGSQLQKKEHILTNVNDFLTSGTYFLSFSQTTINCCQEKQFIVQLEHIFQPILHPCSGNGFSIK